MSEFELIVDSYEQQRERPKDYKKRALIDAAAADFTAMVERK
ncbi:hypothetical protein [Microcoleus sp. herbarium8]